jgi:hypothetical protein
MDNGIKNVFDILYSKKEEMETFFDYYLLK